MADVQSFDKINIIKRRSLPYYEYFGDMELTKEQRHKREALALTIEEVIMIFFNLVEVSRDMNILNEVRVKQELMTSLYEVVDAGYFENEEQLDKYIVDFVNETYRSTIENLDKYPNDYDYTGNSPYWISEDRAQFVAENEANTLYNSADFIEAKKQGKTHKIWITYQDDRVRPTHIEVEGARIPIDSYFDVGMAHMLYPKDVTSEFSTGAEHPEETVNCRCSISYI